MWSAIVTKKHLLLTVSVGLCAACAPKPPAGQPLSIATPAASVALVAAPRVPEPPGLTVTLRVREIGATWRSLATLVPFMKEANELFDAEAKTAAEAVLGVELAQSIDFRATLELGMSDDGAMVWSIPLGSFESALSGARRAFDHRQVNDWAVALKPRTATGQLFEQGSCELWRVAEGRAKLLCSSTPELPADFAAYLAGKPESRGLSEAPIRFEVARSLLEESFQHGVAESTALNDSERLGRDIAGEFMRDLGAVSLGVDPAKEPLELELELEFKSSKSVITSEALGRPSASGPPDAFWLLPKDSLLAISWEGMPPGARSNDVRALLDRFARSLPADVYDPSGHSELTAAMQELALTGGPLSFSYGVDSVAAHLALKAYLDGDPQDLKALESARRALSGWAILAMPEPFEKWRSGIKKLLELDVRYAVKAPLPTSQRAAAGGGASGSASRAPSSSKTLSINREIPVPPELGLPAKAYHLYIETVRNPDYVPPAGADLLPITPSVEHLVVIGVDDKTWLCYAPAFALCADKLASIARSRKNTLGELAAAASARTIRGSWRGLTSPAGLFTLFAWSDTRAELSEALASLNQLNHLPHAGRDLFTLRGETQQSPTSPAATLLLTASVSRQDLLAWFALFSD